MITVVYTLPAHWAAALINGDESGLDDKENAALEAFTADMTAQFGQCWALDCSDDASFVAYHDAQSYGVLACDCVDITFDVTPRD